ncbi:hypothetical protein [Pendulispora albinea]|uniref:Peptidase M1 membrane alanine aminopeptidase domain-containing protein n=1 Tax=Pendulispora albinea TaxID=2741071 RepID=A0ABZ2M5H3_9BACT
MQRRSIFFALSTAATIALSACSDQTGGSASSVASNLRAGDNDVPEMGLEQLGREGLEGREGVAGEGARPDFEARRSCTPGDDLENAPPVVDVDGLRAVPIDIRRLDATVVLDAKTRTAAVEVTLQFRMGATSGYPIFDLRQDIGEAFLNGTRLDPAKLGQHDFGGGAGASLRVIEKRLPACSRNELTLVYALNKPSAANSKAIGWAADSSRVTWDFWLSDLYAGRYLEQWFPANLIYDKFAFDLDLKLENSELPHSVVTNGEALKVGDAHWLIAYPKRFTAISPMLVLTPNDAVSTYDTTLELASGRSLELALVKENGITADLPALAAQIKGWVDEFTASTGEYAHGDRLTVYVWNNSSRSMEYDGATTSNLRSLEHELFHSWYARGVKPAGQNDGWIDEAWTVYNTDGVVAFEVKALDPQAPPVLLASANPWNRITAGASYGAGQKLFAGLAAEMGLDPLRRAMKRFYGRHALDVITTQELERFLYCTSRNEAVPAAFHRFVYGRSDAAPAPDPRVCRRGRGADELAATP